MARPTRKTMIIATVVVAVAAVGGGATYLATSPTAPSGFSQASPADGGGGGGKAGRSEKAKARKGERGVGGGGMLGKIEHGEFTTASAEVMQVQRGAITAIDAGSVTVRSTDGFTASYTITPETAVGQAGKGRRAQAQTGVQGQAGAQGQTGVQAQAGVQGQTGAQPQTSAPAPGSAPSPVAGPEGVSQLQTGQTVRVMATKTGTGSNATRITPTRA